MILQALDTYLVTKVFNVNDIYICLRSGLTFYGNLIKICAMYNVTGD